MRVYKFLSATYALENLKEHRLKLSEFKDMNDPFELLGFRWADPEIEDLLTSHAAASYGALCFSMNWKSPLLWSHYADKHRGICLGFDIPDHSDSVQTPIYVDDREMQDPTVLIDALRDRNFWIAEDPIMRKLLLKYKGWRYEEEVRMFARLDGKPGQFSYFDFGSILILREVILGAGCAIDRNEIEARVRAYSPPVAIVKATLASNSFTIVQAAD